MSNMVLRTIMHTCERAFRRQLADVSSGERREELSVFGGLWRSGVTAPRGCLPAQEVNRVDQRYNSLRSELMTKMDALVEEAVRYSTSRKRRPSSLVALTPQ
jgi:hypothetical protein